MAKYHINQSTGRPNACRATKRACPVGGDDQHFEGDKESAKQWAEKKNSENAGGSFGSTVSSKQTAYPNYKDLTGPFNKGLTDRDETLEEEHLRKELNYLENNLREYYPETKIDKNGVLWAKDPRGRVLSVSDDPKTNRIKISAHSASTLEIIDEALPDGPENEDIVKVLEELGRTTIKAEDRPIRSYGGRTGYGY